MADSKGKKDIFLRIFILLIGLSVAHFGVTLFLMADLGSDPFNVLVQGIYRNISKIEGFSWMSHGYTHMGICFLIILLLLVIDKSYIKIGTLLCMFCGGPIIDFFTLLLRDMISAKSPMWIRLMVNGIGCVILAMGMTLVIKSEAGTGPNDLVGIVLSDKLKKKFSIVRVVVDLIFIILGFLLGGTFGVGTVICAILVGPVAGIFLPKSEKLVMWILNRM